ncbi:MAG: hypothetical protein ABR936_11445 [Bacteroidota bacterium]|jgi:hypothetical protein
MSANENILNTGISKELKEFRRLELSEIDGDILVMADAAKIGYDVERLQRLQMVRLLRRLANKKVKR